MRTGSEDSLVGPLSPGTELRAALDEIALSGSGALIVLGDEEGVGPLAEGGFAVGEPFTVARLNRLAAIDGAVILDEDARTILRANVHLHPDRALETSETGIRHRTAERLSRQTRAAVIAVSSGGDVTLYRAGVRSVLP